MLFLLLTFVLAAASFTVLLWVVTLFFQGYYYTEPTAEIHWQAPAAGVALAMGLTFWCWLLIQAAPRPGDIPYDTIFRFSPRQEQFAESVKELWAVRKGIEEPIPYKRHKEINSFGGVSIIYKDRAFQPWRPAGVEAIIIKGDNGDKRTFALAPTSEGGYRQFVDDRGWVITEYDDGPTGIPVASHWGRFLLNLFLNLLHFAAWFICLWLVLRFTLAHAFGLGLVLWLVMTLAILPLVLEQAAAVGQQRARDSAAAVAAASWPVGLTVLRQALARC